MFGVFGSLLLLLIAFAAGGFVTLVVLLAVSNVLQERAAKPGRSGAKTSDSRVAAAISPERKAS